MITASIDTETFINTIRQIIKEEIQLALKADLKEKFLSPEETCNLFQPAITKPTLESYSQRELLKKYYLGGRTWYKYSELIDTVKGIKKFSRSLAS